MGIVIKLFPFIHIPVIINITVPGMLYGFHDSATFQLSVSITRPKCHIASYMSL